MRRVVALALLLPSALARADAEPDPQQHEVDLTVDISVEQGGNAALVDAQYTFTPAGIDRRDVLPAIVRRFERHPSSLWVRAVHNGGSREVTTGIRLGGVYNPFDGVLYLEGEAALERDLLSYDKPTIVQGGEYGYFAARLRGEIGFRPSDLWSIGAFYEGRPVIGTDTEDSLSLSQQSERSGGETTIGGTTTFVTPGERLLSTIRGYGYLADWTWKGFYPGDTTVRGFGGDLRLSYQVTFWTSLVLRGQVRQEHWVDERRGDSAQGVITGSLDRQVTTGFGALDFIYFHQSRYAFRFSLGGGYKGAPPQHQMRSTGVFTLGIGTLLRF